MRLSHSHGDSEVRLKSVEKGAFLASLQFILKCIY